MFCGRGLGEHLLLGNDHDGWAELGDGGFGFLKRHGSSGKSYCTVF